jgi:hypothetical protein
MNVIARVYASSPVEQPGTHARTVVPEGSVASNEPVRYTLSCSQTAGSRKNPDTPISSSLKRISISWGFSCRNCAYCRMVVM